MRATFSFGAWKEGEVAASTVELVGARPQLQEKEQTDPKSALVSVDELRADATLLAEHRIEATPQGLVTFLHQLKAELVEVKKAKALVPQLGDDQFRVREAAMKRLIEGPSLPLEALQKAAAGADREIGSRAQRILSHPQVSAKMARAESRPSITAAVFRTLQSKGIQDATSVLFDIIPLLDDADLVDGACETVAETAGQPDAALLERSLASVDLHLRVAAIRGLMRADSKADVKLRALMDDAEPRLALAAAHTLAQRGDRTSLSALVRLASCPDEHVRIRSEQILRAWTGLNFGFNPFLDPAAQQANLTSWRNWIAADGRTAKLNSKVRLATLPEDLRRGLLLHYTFDQAAKGRLIDSSGNNRHGTLHNEHSIVSGVSGKALEVRGSGDMGDRGGHAALPFIDFMKLEQFTVTLWVYERGMSDEHGEAYVVFGADRAVGVQDSLGISHFNNVIVYRVGGALVQVPFDPKDRNRWVHYALTFQNGRLRAFKDGRLVGEAKGRVEIVGTQAALGRHWWGHGASTSTRFIGAFDELRIYQRSLSPSQVQQLVASAAGQN